MISIFNKYDKSFIWSSDGIIMHTVNLSYLRSMVINFIRTGNISTFVWNVGNGVDLFSHMTHHIFGDFFSYVSILFRTKNIPTVFEALIFIRIYCAGLSFLCYTKYHKLNKTSSIIGALLFAFSSFVFYTSVRHPLFINGLILFPLLMIGIEKIIIEDKKIFYTIIIAITYIVNLYYAYPMSLTLAIYGTLLAIKHYKKNGIKKILQVLLKTLFYSIIGIMISCVLLLPTLLAISSSQRNAGNLISSYSLEYYRALAKSLLHLKNTGFWVVIGTQSLIFITLPLTIKKYRKENSSMLMLLLLLLLPILFAPIGSLFMCFTFPNNRWSFIFSFIFAFLSASFINKNESINKKDIITVFLSLIVFLAFNAIMQNNLSNYMEIQIMLLFIWLIIIFCKDYLSKMLKKVNLYNILLILTLTIGIGIAIKYTYDIDGHEYASEFAPKGQFYHIANTSNNSIPDFNKALNFIKLKDDSFYKISKYPYNHPNVSLIKDFNSTGSYVNIVPREFYNLNLDINNSKFEFLKGFREFDYRTKINSLMGVKYLINYNKGIVPYGFEEISDYKGKSKIYENKYYLPFATIYTNYITEEEYNNLSSLEKESSLLKATVLEDNKSLNHLQYDYSNNIEELKYNIVDDKKIINNKDIKITKDNENSFEIEIDQVKNSELYVYLENLKYTPYTKDEMINLNIDEDSTPLEIAKVKKSYKWYQINTSYKVTAKFKKIKNSYSVDDKYTNPYLENLPGPLLNLGYYDEASGTIKITLSKIGKYTFDSIKVYAVSMDDYEEDINNLRKSNFEVTNWDDGYLKGTVNAEENGILQFQTIYTKGFKVYVDGKEVETIKSNKYFLGINIAKGTHEIRIEYHTPYFKEGVIISLLGTCVFIGTIISRKKVKKVDK